MGKKSKLAAVLSAAALLVIGTSMTAFADWENAGSSLTGTGWEEENNSWVYLDKDGNKRTETWILSGSKRFYLDADGEMATDSWVNYTYYVDEDGARVTNTWMYLPEDTDIDSPEDDGENWYYFGSNGKKVTGGPEGITENDYYFDEDGKMEYGWYKKNDDIYYLGGEDDGARRTGWQWLKKPDDDDEEDDDEIDCGSDCEICDEAGWYYFGTKGKMYKEAKAKNINGRTYYFNEHGQMLYEWINGYKITAGSNAQLDGALDAASRSDAFADAMIYAAPVTEGYRAEGWYEIDGAVDAGNEGEVSWYYFDKGEAKRADWTDTITFTSDQTPVNRAKYVIDRKKYCFNEDGEMQTGLQAVPENGKTNLYFFGDDGAMKTGKVANVETDDGFYTYFFSKKTGMGLTGVRDGTLYYKGQRVEADEDYELYAVDGSVYLVDSKGKCQKSESKEYTIVNPVIGGEDIMITVKSGSSYKVVEVGDVEVIEVYEGTKYINPYVSVPKIHLYDSVISNLTYDSFVPADEIEHEGEIEYAGGIEHVYEEEHPE